MPSENCCVVSVFSNKKERVLMVNPWEKVDLNTYELHMAANSVGQLQALNVITKQQLSEYDHDIIAILGVAGGNGLENIDISSTKKVYGVDINKRYLDSCKGRYSKLEKILELVCCDLSNSKMRLPFSDILICNLIIEYLGVKSFVELIQNNRQNVKVVSCVIQRNNNNSFVSSSDQASELNSIILIHHDIEEENLVDEFLKVGFRCIKRMVYPLINGKDFIRVDFIKESGV
jgi:hypothetical protein